MTTQINKYSPWHKSADSKQWSITIRRSPHLSLCRSIVHSIARSQYRQSNVNERVTAIRLILAVNCNRAHLKRDWRCHVTYVARADSSHDSNRVRRYMPAILHFCRTQTFESHGNWCLTKERRNACTRVSKRRVKLAHDICANKMNRYDVQRM